MAPQPPSQAIASASASQGTGSRSLPARSSQRWAQSVPAGPAGGSPASAPCMRRWRAAPAGCAAANMARCRAPARECLSNRPATPRLWGIARRCRVKRTLSSAGAARRGAGHATTQQREGGCNSQLIQGGGHQLPAVGTSLAEPGAGWASTAHPGMVGHRPAIRPGGQKCRNGKHLERQACNPSRCDTPTFRVVSMRPSSHRRSRSGMVRASPAVRPSPSTRKASHDRHACGEALCGIGITRTGWQQDERCACRRRLNGGRWRAGWAQERACLALQVGSIAVGG